MINLNEYVCTVPFTSMEIHDESYFLCCASWLTKYLPKNQPMDGMWNSEESIDIRKSVMDGTYRNCDKTQCPYLSQLINLNNKSLGPIKHINELPEDIKKYVVEQNGIMETGPKIVHMSFDRSCNLKCPSCRVESIMANGEKLEKIDLTIEKMEELYSNSVETIYCSGTADPFASKSYRNYLKNFDPKKYPNLKHIHLHTNATLWDEKMWEEMKNIHPYVKTCEISIDAARKETYENVTRLGGNWGKLISNLKFISTIKSLTSIKCSFVVQQSNYTEMTEFLELIHSIFGMKTKVFFGKITNWGTFSDGQYKILKVWDNSHPEFNLFLEEFKKVALNPYVFHNMYDLLDNKKSLI